MSVSPSYSPSPGPNYGLSIAKSGYNADTETDIKNLIFTSARGVLGLRELTTIQDTTDANGDIEVTTAHNIGYVPIAIVGFTTYSTSSPNSTLVGKKVLCPIEWRDFYMNSSKQIIEVTEIGNFYIDATNIRITLHVEAYNHDTGVGWDIVDRSCIFKVYYYFNELVETT